MASADSVDKTIFEVAALAADWEAHLLVSGDLAEKVKYRVEFPRMVVATEALVLAHLFSDRTVSPT